MIKSIKIVLVFIVFALFSCKQDVVKVNTIQLLKSPTVGNSMQPFLFKDGNNVLMSWTQKINDSSYTLNYSTLSDKKWSIAKEITRGNDWFVNWADFPAIAKNKENILTHYLQKSDPATFAYDVHIKQSQNAGLTWDDDKKLHQDSTLTEHGFVTLLPYKDGFFATWLDGRNTGAGAHGDSHESVGAMNIRAATITKNGDISDDTLVDAKTCDCCQTSAAITQNGPIIVYRDRTDEEIRDIYISRQVDNKWTEPKAIYNDNWKINGCPVNGPKAASFENTLVVAWFTAANNKPKVNFSFSDDNGESFEMPIQIDNGKAIGRVDVALIDKENALVSWMESTEFAAEIKVMKVNKNGTKSAAFVVSPISAARGSGFPQMELVNNELIFAWNQVVEKQSTIKTVSFSINVFN